MSKRFEELRRDCEIGKKRTVEEIRDEKRDMTIQFEGKNRNQDFILQLTLPSITLSFVPLTK